MSVNVWQEIALPRVTAQFHFSAHSDRGAVRKLNEDSFLAAFPLFVVADGMGGHSFGDKASQAAISVFTSTVGTESPAAPQAMLETIEAANEAVIAIAADAGEPSTISGTTLTGVAFVQVGPADSYHWMAFNVGDSRTYSWDGRTLSQVSVDHSAVQELIDLGQLLPKDAARHPQRNIVTRALGAEREVDADIWLLPARARQTFLICSDGLTKELSDEEIARIIVFHDAEQLRESDSLPMTLAERLVNAAIAAGGSDNVTVVVVESELVGVPRAGEAEETLERDSLFDKLEDTRPRG